LDTVDPKLFKTITRRDVLHQVLDGIQVALQQGFKNIRINAVPLPSIDDNALLDLARYCRERKLELRFIEFMPLDGDQAWEKGKVREGKELQRLIAENISQIQPADRSDPSQPAIDYRYEDNGVKIGFIDSVSQPFCATCNRMRLTAEGKFRNCLFSDAEWDVREVLRGGTNEDVEAIVRKAIHAKKRGHGSDDLNFDRPTKAMYQIGG
jgi:cyclic pyranopterin phosphate synthase